MAEHRSILQACAEVYAAPYDAKQRQQGALETAIALDNAPKELKEDLP